jgi:hypothetical protein
MYPFLPPTAYVPSALSASSTLTRKMDVGDDWFLAGQSWFRIRQVGGWFNGKGKSGSTANEGIVNISGKGDKKTLSDFAKGDQPDWVKLVTSIE